MVVSNVRFWIYSFALLTFWIIVLTTAFSYDSSNKNKISLPEGHAEDELKNTRNCKSLCKQCGCLGFYCGEECICECNNKHSDTECIREIQINAEELNIPFEVLIQGPTANNFVRTALLFEQNKERNLHRSRNKRSSVTVYKPNMENQNMHQELKCEKNLLAKEILNVTKNLKNHSKRSTNNFYWFSDLKTNLLRPAPRGSHKRQPEELKAQSAASIDTTVSSLFDPSWLFDNNPNIFTPKPLNKRKSSKLSNNTNTNENNSDLGIEKINPQRYQVANKKLADHHYEGLRNSKIKDDNSFLLPEQKNYKKLQDYLNVAFYSQPFEDGLSKIPKNLFSEEEEQEEKTLKNGLVSQRQFKDENGEKNLNPFRIPWLKPVKFLEKFRKVINQ